VIDLSKLDRYRENNRIEAKRALGGLPHSIWETYSAFANTLGGIILLGVEEYPDKTLHTVDLPDPEELVREFWAMVNDPQVASVNVLSEQNVRIENVSGHRIVVIDVPRAHRLDRPVYVNGNPTAGAYRRTGEGDYHCTEEELRSMYRDAARKSQDMRLLEGLSCSVLSPASLQSFRRKMDVTRPGHVMEAEDDEAFLLSLGAVGRGKDDALHPTAAGLLMFGSGPVIREIFPRYSLCYREFEKGSAEPQFLLSSSDADWSGNVCDFFARVLQRLTEILPLPGGKKAADALPGLHPVLRAAGEALTNCLVNADYYREGGVNVEKRPRLLTISNPGQFRIRVAQARSGGLSDPRNGTMMKMFNLISAGESTGSGIPNIFYVWKQQGWAEPSITQALAPDVITVSLPLGRTRSGAAGPVRGGSSAETEAKRQMIVDYLTEHVTASSAQLSQALGLSLRRTRELLRTLREEDVVAVWGGGKYRSYSLRSDPLRKNV